MNVFVLAILFYLLYRFIGGFLIPLFRTTRQVRQQFQDMNGRQQNAGRPGDNGHGPAGTQSKAEETKTSSVKGGEYIDFEEIK